MVKPSLGSQLDPANPINNNIIGCWIFNEGSGNIVTDISGNGNHGTIHNATWNPTGRDGPSLNFNGINADTIHPNDPNFSTNMFTASTWIRSGIGFGPIIANVTFSPVSGIYFDVNNANIYVGTGDGTNKFYSIVAHGGLTLNTWYHIATTVTTTTIKVYINGVLISTNSTGALTGIAWSGLNPLRIGRNDGAGSFFDGIIDEVRIWNRVLSDTEIQTLYTFPYSMFLGSCPPISCSITIS